MNVNSSSFSHLVSYPCAIQYSPTEGFQIHKTSNTFPCYQINVESSTPVFSQRDFPGKFALSVALFSFCFFYVSLHVLKIIQHRDSIFLSIRANPQDYSTLMFLIKMNISLYPSKLLNQDC